MLHREMELASWRVSASCASPAMAMWELIREDGRNLKRESHLIEILSKLPHNKDNSNNNSTHKSWSLVTWSRINTTSQTTSLMATRTKYKMVQQVGRCFASGPLYEHEGALFQACPALLRGVPWHRMDPTVMLIGAWLDPFAQSGGIIGVDSSCCKTMCFSPQNHHRSPRHIPIGEPIDPLHTARTKA